MLIINVSITCVCVWGIAKVYNMFIRRSIINSYRFKLFTLRDKLCLLAMKNKISSTDKEYATLLSLLNRSIKVFDDSFTFAEFFKFLTYITSDKYLVREVNDMVKKLKKHNNQELALIACMYFELNYSVFTKYTHNTPLSLFVKLLAFVGSQIKANRIELEQKIDTELENNLQQLQTVCV